jgi:signal transduction histidine kinase
MPKLAGRRQSIRTQLILWNILTLSLLLGVLGVITRFSVQSFMIASVDHELDMRVRPMVHPRPPMPGPPFDGFGGMNPFPGGPPPQGFMHPPDDGHPEPPGAHGFDSVPFMHPPDGGHPPDDDHPPPPPPDRSLYRPRRFDLKGQSLDRDGQHTPWDPKALTRARLGDIVHSTITIDGEPYRVLSHPYPGRGTIQGVVQIPYPLTEVYRAVADLSRALLTLIPIGLLCAGIGGVYLTNRVLYRVRLLSHAAEHIGARDFSRRLPVVGSDEFAELAGTFNGLLGRLDTAYQQQGHLLDQQRRFVADASHELKTPLTIIQGNASLTLNSAPDMETYQDSMHEIAQAAGTMSQLVQDLLLLARSDSGQLGKVPIELLVQEILERAINGVAWRAETPIHLHIADSTLTVLGNEGELVRLFTNLLDNALRYTPGDGEINVTASRQGDQVRITVADTGVGIAPEHLVHLGERFFRADASRSRKEGGTGLGLSICKAIVQAHRGTITFESTVGVGTTVQVTLPMVTRVLLLEEGAAG